MYHHHGAHLQERDGVRGVHFAVWAPNAKEVSVLCDRNHWKPGQDWLWGSDTGIWSGFIPEMQSGEAYKFGIRTQNDHMLQKADPFAFYAERPPKTASVVYDLSGHEWQDANWMSARQQNDWHNRPVSIYEVHLGSWKRPTDGRRYFNYREIAPMLIEYVQQMGYTHIQLMPLTEHPFDGSWGYQTTGYFAPTSRYGTPHDFMEFVDQLHQAGIGVLIDWVPAHFPTDAHGLGDFDGTHLYEHSDQRQGFHPDWGTFIFNYERFEVKEFLLASARFWCEQYHIDGIRVDAVASMLYLDYSRREGEWVPNQYGGRENLGAIQFLKDFNAMLHGLYPGILTVAEESTAWGGVSHPVDHGGLGFNFKWDMGWMNDTLRYMGRDPLYRCYHQNDLSFRMIYAFSENFILPLSHDEVVHGKRALLSQMPGDYWQQFANLRLLYGYQYAQPGKKLLFMGGEFGQWTEWNHDSEIDWPLLEHDKHAGVRQFLSDLNRCYAEEPALYETDCDHTGFEWIQCDDAQNSVVAFIRYTKDHKDFVVVVGNFTPEVHETYRIGVPQAGYYDEIINSDAEAYGGSNVGNGGGVQTEDEPSHGHDQSLELKLPPLGILILKPL